MPNLIKTYIIETLSKKHDRCTFDCGVPELNDYFKMRAGQDARRNAASVWVAVHKETRNISGYFTLSMAAIPLDKLSDKIKKKLPRYGNIPAIRLGRLAVAKKEQGKGLGRFLLTEAMILCLRNEIAWALFLVDAKDDKARFYYQHLGFISIQSNPNALYMPRPVVEKYFSSLKT
jgi:GNAT superfamily N-acetyltransferase